MKLELLRIVRALGVKLLQWSDAGITDGSWDGDQFKAKADIMAHEFLLSQLNRSFSGIPIISEEDFRENTPPKEYFIIDPIDGTASFVGGFSGFVTQVGFVQSGVPKVGVVYAPKFDRDFHAELGKGAFSNDRTIKVCKGSQIQSIVDNYPEPRGTARDLVQEFRIPQYVELGSLALKTCVVACGKADVFVKSTPVRDWDIMPPLVILQEAGGVMSPLCEKVLSLETKSRLIDGLIVAKNANVQKKIQAWALTNRRTGFCSQQNQLHS